MSLIKSYVVVTPRVWSEVVDGEAPELGYGFLAVFDSYEEAKRFYPTSDIATMMLPNVTGLMREAEYPLTRTIAGVKQVLVENEWVEELKGEEVSVTIIDDEIEFSEEEFTGMLEEPEAPNHEEPEELEVEHSVDNDEPSGVVIETGAIELPEQEED